ncbi:hypothetical protein [Jeotgalibaca sp. A122]|uniref:hypothetical protein n=1 Tax=Jeotgalibaca sp. A122 TaxID=3457322 RepID=UPI003FD4F0E7
MKSENLMAELMKVPGIVGIVSGEAFPDSDHELCLYYEESLDWDTINEILDKDQSAEIGPLWRNYARVETAIADCLEGRITIDYRSGHPHGFVSTIYAAEIYDSQILWESSNKPLSAMKKRLEVYPSKLKTEIIDHFMFEATYSMENAVKAAARGDIHYTLGCFFRTVSSWNQVLFALNQRYLINEEGATKKIKKLPIKPEYYLVRTEQAYTYFASHNPVLGFDEYKRIHNELKKIVAQNH